MAIKRAIAQAVTIVRIDVVQIVAGEYRNNPGQCFSLARIDGFNGSVGKRTSQNFAFEQSGKRDIARVLRLSRHFLDPVRRGRTGCRQ